MPDCCDAKFLEVLRRQVGQDRLVYLVLAECRLLLPEAEAPQPDHDVHRDAYKRWRPVSSSGEARVSRQGVQLSVSADR